MKSAVETLEPTRAKLTVEVSYEELKPSIDHAYSHIAEQVNVPGFRKGKVPARIIDQRVGRAAVIEHAVNDALPNLYRDAVAETGIKPLGQPEVDVTEVPNLTGAVGGQLTFTAEVDVRPEITLPDLSTYEIAVDSVEVTDEDVEQRLESLRERFGTLVGVDRAAADDDFVSIDLRATVGEEEVDSVTGTSYQVGAGTMLEGMDEAITGLSAGESTTFTTTLVGGERAGEEAEVTVTVNSVKERELPAADDEFAELASEFDTIEELRADLREQVGKDKNSNRAVAARDQLLERLRGEIEFPLPKNAVDAEIKAHLEAEGKAEDDPHGEEVREDTEKAMRDQFILDELAQALEVQVGQNELLEFLLSTSRQYGMDPNEFIQSAGQAGQIPVFAGELARNKALAVALRKVKVVDGEGKDVDLSDFIGSDDEDAAAALAEAAAVADAAEPAVESADSAESADSGDSADSADSGDSADSAESAPSAD
ncbi:trigger factor [Georgenia satyanarayanai]|uniref:Trigger factor n=1 Tax=Georgenia satyanarayanai TaxID=860221 RepID=A0A2Y9AQ14_9MICO|nr:trigger factor [Georgenia satyanarayanai]PYF96757.1 trigger factor [Georgenia satyanarayanai]SSA46500.1 trigger factor [Georgenia satyanarayanai]